METFLRYSDLTGQADDPVYLESTIEGQSKAISLLERGSQRKPSCRPAEQPLPRHLPKSSTPTTLRRLLKRHMDLRSPPRKSFFEWLRRFANDEREIERLDEFIKDPVSPLPLDWNQFIII